METFISSILENGLVKIELTVRPETAQHLYLLHLRGELSSAQALNQEPRQGNRASASVPAVPEVTPINSIDELDSNEVALLAALADYPTSRALPTSKELVQLVDWNHYAKSGSNDETARASSLRVNLQKLDGKGVFRKRGLKGNTERYLTDQGLEYAKQARIELYGRDREAGSGGGQPQDELPDFNPHGRSPTNAEEFVPADLFEGKNP